MSPYLIPKDHPPPSYESISSLPLSNREVKPSSVFVAGTVSATVMLLLWQLQNLTNSPPPNNDDPWYDPYLEY
ncbi:hypothetical protein BY458DRAFT_555131 [Sporodiniella umbellata]|nr:hypothetical protein BY458DRAFT_555131 [Sporodiniella umbellata]